MQKLTIMCMALLCLHLSSFSQTKLFDQPVVIQKCQVTINANAFVANTALDLELLNPGIQEIEGQQYFQLLPEQLVTGFQLELNGKLRDGSIEERSKANRAYSTIVGKRIDPALLQMLGDNQYKLNVYPISGNGTRRVVIHVMQLLTASKGKLNYECPLSFAKNVKQFSLHINVDANTTIAKCEAGLIEGKIFNKANNLQTVSFSSKDIWLYNTIRFSLTPKENKPVICVNSKGNEKLFFLQYLPPVPDSSSHPVNTLSVCWDISGSATERNLPRELNFLEKYIAVNNIQEVDFILFNNKVRGIFHFKPQQDDFYNIRNFLKHYDYNGATALGCLDFSGMKTNQIMVFSDGINSLSTKLPQPGASPVTCIWSSPKSDDNILKKVSGATGGQVINLNNNTPLEVMVKKSSNSINYMMTCTADGKKIALNKTLPAPIEQTFFLTGVTMANEIKMHIGNSNAILTTETISLMEKCLNCDSTLAKQISLLLKHDSLFNHPGVYSYNQWYDKLIFGLQHKVMTPYTAFIVLERIEDYIKYKIEPPKELEQACAEMNYVYSSEYLIRKIKMSSQDEILASVAKTYNQKIAWWNKEAPLINIVNPQIQVNGQTNVMGNDNTRNGMNMFLDSRPGGTQELTSVVVTAMGQSRQARSLGYAISTIRGNEITSTNPVNIQNGLTGKVSGLLVQSVNNSVLQDTRITIRGIRSLTGNNQPLLVVDGVPVPISFISQLNPNDVREITVLKSASAAVIYGSAAVNGAILVTLKKSGRYNFPQWTNYNLSDAEDVEYIEQLKNATASERWDTYQKLLEDYANDPVFYIDAADFFFTKGDKMKAEEILNAGAEKMGNSAVAKRTLAFIYESWKQFDAAIEIYQDLLIENPTELETMRDLALAYFQQGNYQKAIDTYYKIILAPEEHNDYYGYLYKSIKLTALDELNAVIAFHREGLDLSAIPLALIRKQPIDMKICVESNSNLEYPTLKTPDNQLAPCRYFNENFKEEILSIPDSRTTNFYIKKAIQGKYTIEQDLYNYVRNNSQRLPHMTRVIIFKHFQQANQSLEITNIMLDNQNGSIAIAQPEWK